MHSVAAGSKLSSEKSATAADLVDAGLRDELANRVTNFGNAAKRTTERVKTHNWRTPKAQKLTYAQQCVQAYKRRWQLARDAGASAYRARQSSLSRLQYYSSGRPECFPGDKA